MGEIPLNEGFRCNSMKCYILTNPPLNAVALLSDHPSFQRMLIMKVSVHAV